MINHAAIYALYKNVIKINGETAYDENDNVVEYDIEAIKAWKDPNLYKIQRAKEYPSVVDQLDTIFHNGLDVWKEQIQAIKDKYPK